MRTPVLLTLAALISVAAALTSPSAAKVAPRESPVRPQSSHQTFLPYVAKQTPCQMIGGQSYDAIPIASAPSDRPAEQHPDLNLMIRGWEETNAPRGLVDYGGGTDSQAPRLYGLFADNRTPTFTSTHRVYDWNWDSMTRGSPIDAWPVTLLGMGTAVGETIHLPPRDGPDIYQGTWYALVLYATNQSITLKYTREDNVGGGYTIHVENVCVEPNLLALYEQMNQSGRGNLPALRAGQPFARARGSEILVAIRDAGSFMDPRSRKDWWPGR